MAQQFSPRQLVKRRRGAQLSRAGLASAIGSSFWSVREWERGKAAPSASALASLADALKCSIDDLFERADP